MPAGARIQFRYGREWVERQILDDLADRKRLGKRRGGSALITYVDQTELQRDPELIPCRMATLVDAVPLGRTVSLQLELTAFAFAPDIGPFNDEVASLSGDLIPRRKDEMIQGSYWFEIKEALKSITKSTDLAVWENIVEQVAARPDFKDERFFYTIEGLVDISPDEHLAAKENAYQLSPNREYDLRIYHFHPTEGDPKSLIGVEASHPSVIFTTNPQVLLDSRYDLKRIRLRTMSPASREPGVLAVRRQVHGHTEWEWEFDLPIEVRGAFWRRLGLGLLIGIFLSVSPVVSAYSNPNLSENSQVVISLVGIVAGILAGIAASFGLRRSV
jgi:hypothetical protein